MPIQCTFWNGAAGSLVSYGLSEKDHLRGRLGLMAPAAGLSFGVNASGRGTRAAEAVPLNRM